MWGTELERHIKEQTQQAILKLSAQEQREQFTKILTANVRYAPRNGAGSADEGGTPSKLTFKNVITIINGEWSRNLAEELQR